MMLGVALVAAAYSNSLLTGGARRVLLGIQRWLSLSLLAAIAALLASWIPDAVRSLADKAA
jgi:hypothetical protein